MKQTAILLITLAIITLIAGFIYFQSNQNNQQNLTVVPTLTPSSSTAPSELLQGGSSYSDPNGVFTFLYPNNYQIDGQNNGQMTRVFKLGPTQQGQTEMYDGVIVHFERVDLGGKSLSDWVDDRIAQSIADGTSQVVTPKAPATLNNYPGFSYELRGLGTFENQVFQKDTNSNNAVLITTLVADPGNLGFQQEVNEILSTLQILK